MKRIDSPRRRLDASSERWRTLAEALTADGLRLTRPRQIILEAIARAGAAFTAGRLVDAVAEVDRTIGRASVFRVLNLMKERGLVERLHGDDGERYTLCLEEGHHHHVTCDVCGRSQALPNEALEAVISEAVRSVGYLPGGHVVAARGVCQACRTAP